MLDSSQNMFLRLTVGLLALLVRPSACALFEDQKGSSDWLIENVGSVRTARLLRNPPVAIVASEQGFLGAVAMKNGAIRWRREVRADSIEVSEALDAVFASGPDGVTAWQLKSGQLLWSAPLPADAICVKEQRICTVAKGAVACRAIEHGGVLWTAPASAPATLGVCAFHNAALHVASWTPGASAAIIQTLAPASGEAQREAAHLASSQPLGERAAIAGDALVALSQDQRQLCVGRADAFECTELPEGARATALSAAGAAAAVHLASDALALYSTAEGSARHVATLSDVAASSPLFTHNGEAVIAAASKVPSGSTPAALKLAVHSAASAAVMSESTVKGFPVADANGRFAQVQSLWAVPAPVVASPPIFRCAMTMQPQAGGTCHVHICSFGLQSLASSSNCRDMYPDPRLAFDTYISHSQPVSCPLSPRSGVLQVHHAHQRRRALVRTEGRSALDAPRGARARRARPRAAARGRRQPARRAGAATAHPLAARVAQLSRAQGAPAAAALVCSHLATSC
jgi:hypothetical protein